VLGKIQFEARRDILRSSRTLEGTNGGTGEVPGLVQILVPNMVPEWFNFGNSQRYCHRYIALCLEDHSQEW